MAKVIDTVAIKMIADVTGIQDGLGKIPKEVNEAARLVQSLASPTDMLASKQARLNELKRMGAVTDEAYAVSLARIKNQMDDLNRTSDKATISIKDFGREIAERIPGFGAIAAGAFTATAAIAGLREVASMAAGAFRELEAASSRVDDIADEAERLGLSIGALSELKLAATFGDVKDFSTITGMMEKMQIKISEAHVAGSEAAKAFEDIGINVRDIARLAPERQFELVAEKLSEVGNAGRQMELIKDTLGRSGNDARSLVNNLDDLLDKVRASGGVLTEADAKAAAEVDEALKSANLSYEKFSNTAARGNAEILKDWYGIKETVWDVMRILQTPRGEVGTRFEDWLFGEENAADVESRALAAENRKMNGEIKVADEAVKAEKESKEVKQERMDMESLAAMETKARMEYELSMIREIIKEDEELLKIEERKIQSAQKFKDSLLSPEEKSAKQIAEAMQLAEGGFLGQGDINALVEREARNLIRGGGGESRLQAKMFGSQEAIAATLGRQGENDSQRLESMKQSLLEMAKRPPIEVKEVSAI